MSQVLGGPDRERWSTAVLFVWFLFWISVVSAIFIIYAHGTYEVSSHGLYGVSQTRINVTVWAVSIGQSVTMLFVAILFSMTNSIYKNSCDIILPRELEPENKASDQSAASLSPRALGAANGRGIIVGYVDDDSPLKGIVEPGLVILRINGSEVSGIKDAANRLKEGQNEVAFFDHQGHLLDRIFTASAQSAIGIRPA